MTNHGCRFDWCTNDMHSCDDQRLEHMGELIEFTASGVLADGRATIALSLYFNEGSDPAPTVTVGVEGERGSVEAALRLEEAIVVQDALAGLIRQATDGTALDPQWVMESVRMRANAGGER